MHGVNITNQRLQWLKTHCFFFKVSTTSSVHPLIVHWLQIYSTINTIMRISHGTIHFLYVETAHFVFSVFLEHTHSNSLPTIAVQRSALLSLRNIWLLAPHLCRLKIVHLLFLTLKTTPVPHPYLCLSGTTFSTPVVTNVGENTSTLSSLLQPFLHQTLG